jgi:hypothetical protein
MEMGLSIYVSASESSFTKKLEHSVWDSVFEKKNVWLDE